VAILASDVLGPVWTAGGGASTVVPGRAAPRRYSMVDLGRVDLGRQSPHFVHRLGEAVGKRGDRLGVGALDQVGQFFA